MEEKALEFITYYEIQKELVKKLVAIRKRQKISQKRLALLSGVPYGTIRRFENSGDISLASFVKILIALDLIDELKNLFNNEHYSSIEEVIND